MDQMQNGNRLKARIVFDGIGMLVQVTRLQLRVENHREECAWDEYCIEGEVYRVLKWIGTVRLLVKQLEFSSKQRTSLQCSLQDIQSKMFAIYHQSKNLQFISSDPHWISLKIAQSNVLESDFVENQRILNFSEEIFGNTKSGLFVPMQRLRDPFDIEYDNLREEDGDLISLTIRKRITHIHNIMSISNCIPRRQLRQSKLRLLQIQETISLTNMYQRKPLQKRISFK